MSSDSKSDQAEPEHRRTEYREWAAKLITVAAGLLGTFVVFFGGLIPKLLESDKGFVGFPVAEVNRTLQSLEKSLAEVQQQARLSAELADRIAKAKPADVQVAVLKADVDGLRSEVKRLTEAVGQSPEKALAVPLLRKDMDNLREGYRHDLDATQSEINHVYDLSKWFLGTVVTMALALVGLAVSNFLQLKKG